MNSFERVKAALNHQEPDRVPVMEFVIDPKVGKAIYPSGKDIGDLSEFLDLDGVGCGARYAKGAVSQDRYVDEWGVTYKVSAEAIDHPLHGPIATMADLRAYSPPDPEAPDRLGDLPNYVQRFKGKRAVLFHHRAAFMWSAFLMGLEPMLMSMLIDRELVEGVMDVVLEANIAVARRAVRAGADMIVLGDDYASNSGPLMSPALFEQFILPRLQKMVDVIHEEGAYCCKHSDGNLWPVLDMILGTGIDALNPIEPVAGMDIGEVKRKFGDRVCLVGNIDCSHLLTFGNPDQVRQAVRECIAAASPGGGHIVSSSNSIHSGVKPENYVALVEAVHEFGKYPIRVDLA
ncbi:MAG: uroporphyrinogen decarboxylase family protein [Candidatus Latescibacterota bacterium]